MGRIITVIMKRQEHDVFEPIEQEEAIFFSKNLCFLVCERYFKGNSDTARFMMTHETKPCHSTWEAISGVQLRMNRDKSFKMFG